MDAVEIVTDMTNFNETSLNSSDTDVPQLYYSTLYHVIGFPLTLVIFLVGVVGNLAVVLCVIYTRALHTPTYCHLVSLALADIVFLVSAALPEVVGHFLVIDQWVFGRVCCSLFVFLQYLGYNVSSLSITAFTVERYIAICHPIKAHTMCTVSRARRTAMVVWLFGILYCSPWLFLTTIRQITFESVDVSIEKCDFLLSRKLYGFFFVFDLVAFYLLPLLLSIILYSLMTRVLVRSSHLQHQSTQRDVTESCLASQPSRDVSKKKGVKSSKKSQVCQLFSFLKCNQTPSLIS